MIGLGIFSVLEVSDKSWSLINLFMIAWYVTNTMTSLCLDEERTHHYQFCVIIRLTIFNMTWGLNISEIQLLQFLKKYHNRYYVT